MTGQWDRLAIEVKRRREQLRLRQRDVELRGGPGPGTMRNIEQATRDGYAMRTFDSLERALEWRPGTITKILEGTVTEEELRARLPQTIHPESIPSRSSVGRPTITVDEPRVHEKSGGGAGVGAGGGRRTVSGEAHADLGFGAGVEDSGVGTDEASVERVHLTPGEFRLRFGPGERIPPRDATIVTVAELLQRLRAERDRTPSMDDAEEALVRLLPELYGLHYPAVTEAQRAAGEELERRRQGGEAEDPTQSDQDDRGHPTG